MEGIAICFAYKGSQKFLYNWLHPIGGGISQDAWPKIVDALLTLIFMMWLGAWVFLFCTSRLLICRKWTQTYQCQHFTINSRISECAYECETRNAEPGIVTDSFRPTQRNPRGDEYGYVFGLPRVCQLGFGWVWKLTNSFLRSKPGPLAGYPDPLLKLSSH